MISGCTLFHRWPRDSVVLTKPHCFAWLQLILDYRLRDDSCIDIEKAKRGGSMRRRSWDYLARWITAITYQSLNIAGRVYTILLVVGQDILSHGISLSTQPLVYIPLKMQAKSCAPQRVFQTAPARRGSSSVCALHTSDNSSMMISRMCCFCGGNKFPPQSRTHSF